MHPMTLIAPVVILMLGLSAFCLLPLDFSFRLTLLGGNAVAALVVGYLYWRRGGPKNDE
jgi:hypothetical protein